jgi:hypothetical protein
MVVAMSSLGVFALCVAGIVLLVLVGPAVTNFGRAAEKMTDMGHRVDHDRPEFRKPPDEGNLL